VDEKPRLFGLAVPDFVEQPFKTLPESCKTPYDYHKLFLDDNFVDEMVRTSQLYAIRKDRAEVHQKITNDSIRTSIAIMHMTGYLTPSNRRMYWEHREDTMNPFVRKAMSRNTFVDIISNSYFVESVIPDPNDKFWKVRPLFKQINKSAKTYFKQPQNVSIDEGMIKYFGPHPLKQYMRGKPVRFGYKVNILFTHSEQLLYTHIHINSAHAATFMCLSKKGKIDCKLF
jgi:DNA excision repair protein ERCC-6